MIDVIEYLRSFGAELAGLNQDPKARVLVLRYVKNRLQVVLNMIDKELVNGDDSTGAGTQ